MEGNYISNMVTHNELEWLAQKEIESHSGFGI